MTAQIIAFPDRGALLERKVAEVEKEVESWMSTACPDWMPYSEEIARWAVDPRRLADMLRRFDLAGGRVAYEERAGREGFSGACAELAAEFLAAEATPAA